MTRILQFPSGFVWGASTSAYQIEGAWDLDGKGESIWDAFVRQPGRIERGETGDTAADHYHRWEQDLDLAAELGLQAYCFSTAWPRVQPDGSGAVNLAGLDFYERLVDGLLERGIQPWLKLYHWDLPLALQEHGGWGRRDTAHRFADYALLVARRLGDRVERWITLNEPFVSAFAGHFTGEHAPGMKDPVLALRAAHHLLLAHGYAVQAMRSSLPASAQVGIILDLVPVYPAEDTEADRSAAQAYDGVQNRLFLDPLLRGEYPPDLIRRFMGIWPDVRPEDPGAISEPLDFLGINYYTRAVMRHAAEALPLQAEPVYPNGSEYSQMWEIYPRGLTDLLVRLHYEYRDAPFCPVDWYITENGVPVADGVDFDGRVRDERRSRYLRTHLEALHRAIQAGAPVRGYFHWSLLDNFEWAHGYRMRFGLVHVDWETQKRSIKDSGRLFAAAASRNAIEAVGLEVSA